jgi:hypothetical protein
MWIRNAYMLYVNRSLYVRFVRSVNMSLCYILYSYVRLYGYARLYVYVMIEHQSLCYIVICLCCVICLCYAKDSKPNTYGKCLSQSSTRTSRISNRMKRLNSRLNSNRVSNRLSSILMSLSSTFMKRKHRLHHSQKLPLVNQSQSRR